MRPFSRAAAQWFIEKSGLKLAPGLLEKVLDEAAEIEDMPDRVRPIVLNMFGLVVGSFKGSLPKGVAAGRLLSGYVERSIRRGGNGDVAVNVLRPLVTNAGTKRTLTTAEIGAQAGTGLAAARGCLVALASDGLVRQLPGRPERWEVAHDFVARLLQPMLRSWRRGAWEWSRPYLVPVPLGVLAVVVAGLVVFYPTLHDDYILRKLREVGLQPGPTAEEGTSFGWNGSKIVDVARFWRAVALVGELNPPVVSLSIAGAKELTTLEGLPALPSLVSLELAGTGITTLNGMPELKALTSLDLDRSELTTLQGMPQLVSLESLDLSNTKILTLQGMPALPALDTLRLNGAWLKTLQGMPELKALTSLDLGSTGFATLQGMPKLSALTKLYLNRVGLKTLQGMLGLPQLTEIDLRRAYNVSDLSILAGLPKLARVVLTEDQAKMLHIDPVLRDKVQVR